MVQEILVQLFLIFQLLVHSISNIILINQAPLIQFQDQTIMNMTVQLKILDGIQGHQHLHKHLETESNGSFGSAQVIQ